MPRVLEAPGAICYARTDSMSYVVLARKWRPMSFEDLIGQSHVSRTLANAIQSGRVAHAFLFTGVRGVGKTTSARILAKALNCMGTAAEPRTGPTATPCLECAACREITAGTDVDVREIDGASYNGVDEVRKLQDSLPYRPARDRSKIFIVDEVHMLSQSAWNAFLKTLEEPPPHVKFIFATTEVHKVPVTILSRVQRFDFKMIPAQLIAKRLKHVLDDRGHRQRRASPVYHCARGGRQHARRHEPARSGHRVERPVSRRRIRRQGSRRREPAGACTICPRRWSAVTPQPASPSSVRTREPGLRSASVGSRDLLSALRDLVVSKMCAEPADLLDLADEERRDVTALAERTSGDDLVRLHQGFSSGFDDVVRSGQIRASLELLLVWLARRPALIPIDDLVSRLAALEKRLGARAERAAAPSNPGTAQTGAAARRDEPRLGADAARSAAEATHGRPGERSRRGGTAEANRPRATEPPHRHPSIAARNRARSAAPAMAPSRATPSPTPSTASKRA